MRPFPWTEPGAKLLLVEVGPNPEEVQLCALGNLDVGVDAIDIKERLPPCLQLRMKVDICMPVTPLILSRLHAPRLCFLLTIYVRPDRFYRLPDSLWTLPLSRYLAALVSTRLTMLTFLFRIRFSRSRCLCLLTLLS
jgi:hypothetical protein